MIWSGTWNALIQYVETEVVEYLGSSWIFPIGETITVGTEPSIAPEWELVAASGASGSSLGSIGLNDLTDVSIASTTAGDIITYNGSEWTGGQYGISDFTLSSDFTGHSGDSSVHFTVGSISHTAITDIGVYSHAVIDSFINAATAHVANTGIHFSGLGDLYNVDLSSISDGDVLTYNAGIWSGEAPAGGGGGLSNVVEDVTPELGGNLNAGSETIYFTSTALEEQTVGEISVDLTAGNKWHITLTGDCGLTFADPAGSTNAVIVIEQDSTGNRAIGWPSSSDFRWPGGVSGSLTTGAGSIDILNVYCEESGGSYIYYAMLAKDFQ